MPTTPSDYILDTSRDYSIYVCENRAIPKVSDGLKDGQRKAMYLMRNRQDKIKTISLAGEMISSELYLHGDASASGTISMLAAPYVNNVPYFEGIGNFGTRTAPVDGIGAPRYTYVKRGAAANHLVFQDLDVVPMQENHDGSKMEPVTFLPIIPIVLLNSVSGIAVGWSTEILPRSLKDLIAATVNAINGKKVKRLIPCYEYLNVDVEHIEDNAWMFSGRIDMVDASTIRITELPPDLTLDKFKARLIKLEDDGKIRDFTDRSTKLINIEVKFRRGFVKDWSEEKALNFFKLKSKKTERIVVIDWGGKAIRQYESAEQIVVDFVEWRFGFYVKRYQKLLADTSYELKFWRGIKKCFDDDLPSRLIKLKDKKNIETEVETITKTIGLDEEQIDKIASLPTYRWAKDALQQCKDKIKELAALEKEYKRLLKNPNDIKQIFRDEVMALKKQKFVK